MARTPITDTDTDSFATKAGIQASSYTYDEDAEASDTYVITPSPAITAYAAGQEFSFKANTANTGAATLNVNGVGAKTIKKLHDQDLATGDIEAGSILKVTYDGTNFQLLSSTATGFQEVLSEGAFVDGDKTKLDGVESAATANPNAIDELSEDTTPELGGDLNAGANTIYFTENNEGDSSTAITIDWGLGNKSKCVMTDNATFTFTAPTGPCSLTLRAVQDGSGGHTHTWPASVKWNGGAEPTWSTVAGETNIMSFYYDGTNYYGDGWTES